MASLVPLALPSAAPVSQKSDQVVQISRYMVLAPLQLNLPTALNTSPSQGTSTANASASEPSSLLSSTTDPDGPSAQHLSEEQKLFNNDTGLRGFMTQNWLNKNIGIQGGLAIPEERLRDDHIDLSNQMAVGMGVLFQF